MWVLNYLPKSLLINLHIAYRLPAKGGEEVSVSILSSTHVLVQVLFLYYQELAFPSVLIIAFQTLSVTDGKQSAAFTVLGAHQVCRQSPYALSWTFSAPGPASGFGFFSDQSLVCLHWGKTWGARGFAPPESACNRRQGIGEDPQLCHPWGQELHLTCVR